MQDLMNRGCAHRTNNQWCVGRWRPGAASVPFVLTNNKRWFDQIRAYVAGGVNDYNLDARAGNEARIQESARLAERERAKGTAFVGGNSALYSNSGNLRTLNRLVEVMRKREDL